ncbi:MAG: ATP synthase F0 subunit A [Bacteroidetes bacterium]|nr:MAG: ATP synthase F0 subunit A [Bacteroidota bacterium]
MRGKWIKIQWIAFLVAVLLAAPSFSFASESSGEEKFNAGEMIMHHIKDAHEIHIIGDFAIYLPVIVKTDEGVKLFSSSHFYHNPKELEIETSHGVKKVEYFEHDGLVLFHEKIYEAPEGLQLDEHGHPVNKAAFDLSITKNVLGLFISAFILILLFGSAAKKYKERKNQAPKGIQSLLEPLILFIRDEVAIPSIGEKKAEKFLPFLLTTFFFIWVSNLLGLIPFIGGFNITGTLSITAVLAAFVFIITTINGNSHYWMHILWPPNVPLPIKFILVPIELAGIFIKPIVLMVRLTANITAGHIIILAFTSLIFIFAQSGGPALGYGVGIGSVAFMIFMNFIELLVAFLQAYVFTLLAALYFGAAVEEAHH